MVRFSPLAFYSLVPKILPHGGQTAVCIDDNHN